MNITGYAFIAVKRILVAATAMLVFSLPLIAQDALTTYTQVKAFALTGGKSDVVNLALKRDRVTMTFSGTFFYMAPIGGKVTGAVFVGQGNFKADAPPDDFERANMKRMLGVDDAIESDFKTAVLRFTDDTDSIIGAGKTEGAASGTAVEFAIKLNDRILEQTGANIASRLTSSLLNNESPGFFFADFDGGKRGRFSYVLDDQHRIPTNYFNINAGEKGLIFAYQSALLGNDIWMAFYGTEDYKRGTASYSDQSDLVDITNYDMDVDLRQPKKRLGLRATISIQSKLAGLRAVTFNIGESLGEGDDQRLKKQMRLKSAKMGGAPLAFVQDDWEGGLTIFFAEPIAKGQKFEVEMELDGDFLRQPDSFPDCSYPRSNSNWYPRHGYLDRSTFNFTFTHAKNLKIASTGTRQSEQPDAANKDHVVTKYRMNYAVALATFAVGPFERHAESIKWENGDKPTPLEFNSMPGDRLAIKEDFILAELNNSVRFFQEMFGKYPYESFSAVFHPFNFGQGFATLLTIPNTDRASKYTYAFVSHETAHQWWGNIVSWRSYRDQWLSEGFAEYSGILYTGFRENRKAAVSMIGEGRRSLSDPPQTLTGPGKGKLVDVGPLTMGHRLETKKTFGAYSTLVYNKGALVLRMIHFLMTDPSSGDGQPFYNMMKDFVGRHRDGVASTDDFKRVAGEHFAKTPIAKKYGLKNLDWFFQQWVYDTPLPSYQLTYQIQAQPDGSTVVTGEVTQTNAPEKWFMPLPLVIKFGDNRFANGTVAALGPKTPFTIKLPAKPLSLELDPDKWVLSEKTTTK